MSRERSAVESTQGIGCLAAQRRASVARDVGGPSSVC